MMRSFREACCFDEWSPRACSSVCLLQVACCLVLGADRPVWADASVDGGFWSADLVCAAVK